MASEAGELDYGTTLAVQRTWLAHERTLMAWVRTSASMTSFGFTVYKFFDFYGRQEGLTPAPGFFTPRHFAIVLVTLGLFSLILATLARRREVRTLKQQLDYSQRSLAEIAAIVISIFGGFILVITVLRD
jgi:putative membrane protein